MPNAPADSPAAVASAGPSAAPAPAAAGRRRIDALDVVRGAALCGILLVNIEPVTHLPYVLPTLADPSGWLQLLVQQRFFPIFSLLFGIGFSLLLESAARRTERPRLVLLRRLLVLLPVGALHQLLQPGEALLPYAVCGLLVLLPSSWLPRWAVAILGVVLLPVTVLLAGGGLLLIPALFLLGSALVRCGVVDRMGTSTRVPALLLLVFAGAAVPAVIAQAGDIADSGFSTSSAVAGLSMAGAYVTALLVLLRTPMRAVLHAVLSPLGRTALTNYVTATPVMLLAGHVLGWSRNGTWDQVLLVAALILAAQWSVSTLWLRRFRQGPLEWLWRWATWARRPAFLR